MVSIQAAKSVTQFGEP